jgi:hypothetical protein
MAVVRERFVGAIAGVGSTSGVRLVVGRWDDSPLGAFADVMLERADGHRVLYAPTTAVADFVTATYVFDEIRTTSVTVSDADGGRGWIVRAGDVQLTIDIGGRPALGWLLRAVPRAVATNTRWASTIDPVARTVLSGVRTRGVAREGRREWYGATDMRRVIAMRGEVDGVDLGALAPVDPPCRFGFSSTPRRPAVTQVVTTVERTT